jgi:anti-anti-sigma factor
VPLHAIPVVMPYRVDHDADGILHTVQVHTVASSADAARATAQVITAALSRLRHPGRRREVLTARATVGAIGPAVPGPYAYLIGHGSHVHHVAWPPRLDHEAGTLFNDALAGIDAATLHGVVMDCVGLTYINTIGLAGIAGNAERLRLHLIRVQPMVQKVLDIVGLLRVLPLHPDLPTALDHLVGQVRRGD